MDFHELYSFLEEKTAYYNVPSYIEHDPIQIPHRFSISQDIEIAAFLTATIAWGNRKSIIKDANKMMQFMEESPYEFIMEFKAKDLKKIPEGAIHRTFNSNDFIYFLRALQRIYASLTSLEELFLLQKGETNFYHALERFRKVFFENDTSHRSTKHVSSTYKNSAAKRLMMFLRWMVRKDNKGVDFGIWESINQAYLSVPLDVHSGNVGRKLGIIQRRQNDWKAVEEMDSILRIMDANDPAKYDYALFGLGVNGDF